MTREQITSMLPDVKVKDRDGVRLWHVSGRLLEYPMVWDPRDPTRHFELAWKTYYNAIENNVTITL